MVKSYTKYALLKKLLIISLISFSKYATAKSVNNPSKLAFNDLDAINYPLVISAQYNFGFTNMLTEIKRIYAEEKENKSETDKNSPLYSIARKQFNVNSFAVNIGWIQISKFFCNNFGGYPIVGLSMIYRDFLDVNGYSFSLLPFIHLQRNYTSIFCFSPKLGCGLVYNNIPVAKVRKYKIKIPEKIDLYGDPLYRELTESRGNHHDTKLKNNFSLEFLFGLSFLIRPTKQLIVDINFNYNYIPDVRSWFNLKNEESQNTTLSDQQKEIKDLETRYVFREDQNLGIASFGLGLSYIPNPKDLVFVFEENKDRYVKISLGYSKKEYNRKIEYFFRQALSPPPIEEKKKINTKGGNFYELAFAKERKDRKKLYNFTILTLEYAKKYSYNHAFIFGIEVASDASVPAVLKNIDIVASNNPFTVGVSLGHESSFGRLMVGGTLGLTPINALFNVSQVPVPIDTPAIKLLGRVFANEFMSFNFKFQFKLLKNFCVGCCLRNKIEFTFVGSNEFLSLPTISINTGYPEIFLSFIL